MVVRGWKNDLSVICKLTKITCNLLTGIAFSLHGCAETNHFKCKTRDIQMKFGFCSISLFGFFLPKRQHIHYVLTKGGTYIESILQ